MAIPFAIKKTCLLLMVAICLHSSLFSQLSTVSDSLKYYNKLGQYAKALPFALLQYNATRELGENDTARIAAVNDMGFDYYQLGKYDSAAVYFDRACEAYKKVYGELSLKYTGGLNDLASAYKNTGKFDIAEKLYLKTLSLKKALKGEDPGYAISLNQLGLLYFTLGRYNKAEEYFLKESAIFKKYGEKTADYALAAGNLALVYSRVGNYPRAEQLQSQVLTIRKEILGDKHPMYALALSNLGTIYASMGNYVKADSIQTISLAVVKQALKETHPQYLRCLHNLGLDNTKLKKFTAAKSFYTQAIAGWKSVYGEDDVDYLFMFDALSNLYSIMGRTDLAEPRFLQSLAHYDRLQMSQHPYRLDLLYHIVGLYMGLREPLQVIQYLTAAMQAEKDALLDKLDYLSEAELLFYLQKRTNAAALAAPYAFLHRYPSSTILKAAYTNRLLFSGISAQNRKHLSMQISSSKDTGLSLLWKDYQNNKSLLNKLLSTPLAKRTLSADSVSEIANQQEKLLLRQSAAFRDIKEKLNTSWEDVRDNLQPDETAVEFVRFEDGALDSNRTAYYAAMLVRPQDSVPRFVPLFQEKQLIAALNSFAYKAPITTMGGKPGTIATHSKAMPYAVFKLLWQPLEPWLAGTKTVYFSPDGILHQIAFAAIPTGKNSLLCDDYHLVQLTSTRQIAMRAEKPKPGTNIALFGGINYSRQRSDSSQISAEDLYAYAYQQHRGVLADSFRFLPNSLKEVTVIKQELAPANKTSYLFTGANATEQAFRNLGGHSSPGIIHFATHGFTLPFSNSHENTGNAFQVSENPLLRCGLVMAGGNKGWKGKAAPDEDDGILTGLEISSVSLPNTELVVLSACETGLGQLMGSEGVFGLQRAFKLAGADYVMASLWQVPDKETASFMEHFYKDWLTGKDIRQAFLHTQQVFRKKYPPYFWAGFTLVQ